MRPEGEGIVWGMFCCTCLLYWGMFLLGRKLDKILDELLKRAQTPKDGGKHDGKD